MVNINTIFCLLAIALSEPCTDLFKLTAELEAVESLKGNEASATESCILSSIDKNWWVLANSLATAAMNNDVKLSDAIKTRSLEKRVKVEKMITSFDTRPIVQNEVPAFKWAQSPNKVFMEVVFSNKIDSQGCPDLQEEEVKFEDRRVTFYGTCQVANVKTTYSLELELYDDIDTELSTSHRSSQSRTTITLTKKNAPSAWARLTKGKRDSKLKYTYGVWWEMKEKYKSQMDELIGDESGFLTDDEEEQQKKTDL